MLVLVLIMLFILSLITVTRDVNEVKSIKSDICYSWADINHTLRAINKNCGSMFITTKGNDNNLYNFRSTEKDHYIPLDECLD